MTATRHRVKPRTTRDLRFPFAPLERLIPVRQSEGDQPEEFGRTVQVAEALGVSTRNVMRWRKLGVTIDTADVLATRLGLTPEIIQGWDEYLPTVDADE